MSFKIPTAFFAYPSQPPSLPETIRAAVEEINGGRAVHVKTWEDGRIGGKFIINEICTAIEDADLLLADLTGLNPNVLFEIGFAIAKNKRVWPILDTSFGGDDFTEFRTLASVGYSRYTNSAEISKAYFRDQPHLDLEATLLNTMIGPDLIPARGPMLLYLKSQHDTDASIHISKRLASIPVRLIIDDPHEAPSQTLSWYGQQVYAASAVVCHLTNPARQGARVRNARYALVAGMAFGMSKSVLILCEGEYLAPLDYRDMTRNYATASAALRHLSAWLPPLEQVWRETTQQRDAHTARLRLVTELKGLYLGEYIAENEPEGLVDGYFVETTAYTDAVAGNHTIFVGRKGTGKSANFLQLAAHLAGDARNILSVVKPVAYELEGVLRILEKFAERDKKTFAIEGLWKFLLYSEIAGSLNAKLEKFPAQARSKAEQSYMDFFARNNPTLSGDFSTRLERCIEAIEIAAFDDDVATEEYLRSIATTLHSGVLRELRVQLVSAVRRGARIAVIVDNLDKAWDRQNDLRALAEFLLGLLRAANKIRQELRSELPQSIVSLAVFLRADIFDKVQEVAREPDKIQYTRLTWKDPEVLYKLVDERFSAARDDQAEPGQLWKQFFCETVQGQPTKRFLAESVLPRPRDFIYITKAAISTAVNRGHARVEEDDILEACKIYSEFATGILLIEDNSQNGILEKVLYEFAGAPARITHEDVCARIAKATGMNDSDCDAIVSQLCGLSFLGIEVEENDFRFPESAVELKKVSVLARRLCDRRKSSPWYLVHRAFRPFLEVGD